MISWFKNKNAEPDHIADNNVIAAYGAVLEKMFAENSPEGVFDLNALPFPKAMIKTTLQEAIVEDPDDKALINAYLYLAQFQPLSDNKAGLEQAVEDELQELLSELDKL